MHERFQMNRRRTRHGLHGETLTVALGGDVFLHGDRQLLSQVRENGGKHAGKLLFDDRDMIWVAQGFMPNSVLHVNYLRGGRQVVSGRLETRSYDASYFFNAFQERHLAIGPSHELIDHVGPAHHDEPLVKKGDLER